MTIFFILLYKLVLPLIQIRQTSQHMVVVIVQQILKLSHPNIYMYVYVLLILININIYGINTIC